MSSINTLLASVHEAAASVSLLTDAAKSQLLLDLADLLSESVSQIIQENAKDLTLMDDADPKKDRLMLNEARIADLAQSCRDVAALPDPTGQVLVDRRMENGLHIQKKTVPLGVVGVIYESRPNVTIDVAALCLRSGNAVVLRGGTDAWHSNTILVKLIHQALAQNNISTNAVQLLPTDRAFVKEMLEATAYIDIIIPRGSQQLIDFVREHAKVPTIETGAGVCHTYVETSGILEDAACIVVNAKTQRPSVCNALDTVLVDRAVATPFLPMLISGFTPFQVEVFADDEAFAILNAANYPHLQHATEEDFGREFLSQKCSVKVVSGADEAISHIRRFSSKHSEAIISQDAATCERFLNEIDAAAVYSNASTRFTDGGVFGLGAEIGISTQKLHARGPFALEKLTTEKWVVRGNGQTRK
jgi:glutamate-5-semialdehyde dehydrogenase